MSQADPELPILPLALQGRFCSQVTEAVLMGIGSTINNYLNYNIPVHLLQIGIGIALVETFHMLPNDDMRLSHLAHFKNILDRRVADTMTPAPDKSKLS